MPVLDKIEEAEQYLAMVSASVINDDYALASTHLTHLLSSLQQLFLNPDQLDVVSTQRLQLLSEQIQNQHSLLLTEREQLKDSLGQIAAVKSANKIKKTYQIG